MFDPFHATGSHAATHRRSLRLKSSLALRDDIIFPPTSKSLAQCRPLRSLGCRSVAWWRVPISLRTGPTLRLGRMRWAAVSFPEERGVARAARPGVGARRCPSAREPAPGSRRPTPGRTCSSRAERRSRTSSGSLPGSRWPDQGARDSRSRLRKPIDIAYRTVVGRPA